MINDDDDECFIVQFAVVYQAKDTRTNEDVAVKKIKIGSRLEAEDGIHLTALREIKFLQELKHPNVIEVHIHCRCLAKKNVQFLLLDF